MAKRGKFESKSLVSAKKKRGNSQSKLLLSLVSSIVSMLLCCTMFLGTTMAWFTDEVVSAGNQITIGKLEMDVTFDGRSLQTNPNARVAAPQVFDNSFRWRPDRFEARSLTLENSGSLDIKYVLNLLIDRDDASVAKYFDVYKYTGEGSVPTGTLDKNSRDGWTIVGNLADMYKGGINVLEGELKADETLNGAATYQTIGFALHMKPEVENALNAISGQTLTLSIKLNAYQIDMPAEEIKGTTAVAEAAEESVNTETPTESVVSETTAVPDEGLTEE